MKFLKKIANIALIVLIIFFALIAIMMGYAVYDGYGDQLSVAIIFSVKLFICLFLYYSLNKPKGTCVVIDFYNRKWCLVLSVLPFLIFGSCFAFHPVVLDFSEAFLKLGPGTNFVFGPLIIYLLMYFPVALCGFLFWRCPYCGLKLPFLKSSYNTGRVGFGIKMCPHCRVKLVAT